VIIKNFLIGVFSVALVVSAIPPVMADTLPYEGRWALFLPGGAGWLEVRQEEGYLDADILWYGGSVVPVDNVFISGERLLVNRGRPMVRKRDEQGKPTRTQTLVTLLEFQVQGDQLTGKAYAPNTDGRGVAVTEFTGKRIPPLPPAPDLSKLKFGEPVALFNGKDLSGWTLTDPGQTNGFVVRDGVLVNDPVQRQGQPRVRYGNLKTEATFEDFNLKLDVMVPEGSNSGIYLRGIYEIQVLDSYQKPLDSHNMGAVYSRIKPTVSAEKPAGEWQSLDMTLCDRHVTVVLNGRTIIDNQPLQGVTGGALTADEFVPGPIYLQGDHGPVSFRNMVLRPILK
jgi:hypothetical protein